MIGGNNLKREKVKWSSDLGIQRADQLIDNRSNQAVRNVFCEASKRSDDQITFQKVINFHSKKKSVSVKKNI